MSDHSARLALPFLMPAQAQKHVTHNEALERLDSLVQLAVEAFDAATPPALPQAGQVWALGPAPAAAWSGAAGQLAVWTGTAWDFIAPQPGWRAAQGTELRLWDGTAWRLPDVGPLDNLDGIGINTAHDDTNRLAVAAPATLLGHAGAGHQLKINKAASADTASLLFQTGFSGRAEMGTAGSDDWSIKVSPDGASWHDGITIDRASGAVAMPAGAQIDGLQIDGAVSGDAVQTDSDDATPGRLLLTGAFGLGAGTIPIDNDWDNPKATGWYRDSSNSATGKPFAGAVRGHLMNIRGWEDAFTQLAAERASGRIYTRSANTDGVPGDWFELATTRDFIHNSPTVTDLNDITKTGFYQFGADTANAPFTVAGSMLVVERQSLATQIVFRQNSSSNDLMTMRVRQSGTWRPWFKVWTGADTTVDSNGFLKEASPIVRLFDDHVEEPVQPVGAGFERLGEGHYRLTDVPGLATRGWQIEVPQDANGNRLVHVTTAYAPGDIPDAGVLEIFTAQPVWSMAGMGWVAGPPADIPAGRWVDLRLDAPRDTHRTGDETPAPPGARGGAGGLSGPH